jgi:hypothetical protein
VGGVLQQKVGNGWKPLAFYSKKLTSAEVKYSTFDRELLAAFSTIRHFRFLLDGRQFQLLTDHKPLVAAMTRVSPPQSARQQHHLAYVSEFTTDLRHTPGSENVVTDALSRPPPVVGVASSGLSVLSIPPVSLPRQTALQVPMRSPSTSQSSPSPSLLALMSKRCWFLLYCLWFPKKLAQLKF